MGTDAKSTVISFDMNRPLLHGARDIQLVPTSRLQNGCQPAETAAATAPQRSATAGSDRPGAE